MTDTESDAHGRVTLRERMQARERDDAHRTSDGTTPRPQCLVVGHFWTDDEAGGGRSICLVCQVVRFP